MFNIHQNARSPQQEKEKKEKKKESRGIVLVGSVILSLILAGFIEANGSKLESVFNLLKNLNWVISILLEMLGTCLLQINSREKKDNSDGDGNIDKWTKVICIVKKLWRNMWDSLKNDPYVLLFFMIAVSFYMGIFLGNKQIFARSSYAVGQAVEAFKNYNTEETKKMKEEQKMQDNIKKSHRGKKVWENQDGTTQRRLDTIKVSNGEAKEKYKLSQKDTDELFYLNGKYMILDWEDQEEINRKVYCRIQDEIKKKRKNVFDMKEKNGGASPYARKRISELSDAEGNISTLEEKKKMVEERVYFFNQYAKGSLSQLIANDYQEIALVFYYQTDNRENVLYYYGQSIKYRHQTTSFKGIGNSEIKNRVIELKKSYEDLELIFTYYKRLNDNKNLNKYADLIEYAKKLEKAYQYVADQY